MSKDRWARCAWGSDGLSHPPRLSATHQVRPEEADDHGHDGKGEIAVDVLAMVEEVSVNHFVDDDDQDHDQHPDPPVGNEMPPHNGSIRFATHFVKPIAEEGSGPGQLSGMSPERALCESLGLPPRPADLHVGDLAVADRQHLVALMASTLGVVPLRRANDRVAADRRELRMHLEPLEPALYDL